ncbi:pirin family protein [Microbacterium sp. SORGH_AS_0888]|uniref:pirin family protein n=1 Tax=Microbacterium sp. SORGH_AS_0888 TaxID=3041791 RepID=UPI00278A2E94|nr:pirin family protein [Microbacterium sp. SORGH_AS_0888]MDQ1130157.1 redox-sensitive bicupin YhaK (pirin superfamily) [Microbacterium sp. SORGH_AS_0888]
MTRLDAEPEEAVAEEPSPPAGPRSLLLEARDVPLGGVRAMEVHRSLPQRDLPTVGAWCFLDRFGPQRARMRVEPHPHIGLQTVTWPIVGEVRHRDAVGSDVVIARSQLNLMTSGAGISHSEYSVGEGEVPLDALQLWVALPESRRHGGPAFERHERLPEIALPTRDGPDAVATVVMGELAGVSSPATAYTPIVGAELRIPQGAVVTVPLHEEWEYALAGVHGHGALALDGGAEPSVRPEQLLYLGTQRARIEIAAPDADTTLFLLGGEPFEDDIVMWWNFVGRSHDEILAARDEWEAGSPRFGHVVGHGDERIPAPPLPHVRLTRRRRRL